MNKNEHKYLKLLGKVASKAVVKDSAVRPDRTGTGTFSKFGVQIKYPLGASERWPTANVNLEGNEALLRATPITLLSKRVHLKSVIHELLWFLKGDTNTKYLEDNGVTIWREWQDYKGDLGPIYGSQWRGSAPATSYVDQIKWLENEIRTNPHSRRLVVSAWNPDDLPDMALPPCHMMFQVYIHKNGTMDLLMYQRSADLFLGVPFNICQYSILLIMLCAAHGYTPGKLIHTIGDAHVYSNHLSQVREQLNREEVEEHCYPTLTLPKKDSILDYTYDDFVFSDYCSHPAIKAPVAI